MTGDDNLASRVRAVLGPLGATEKKMFGGVCFLLGGNMVAGTAKGDLLLRVGKEAYQACLALPHARVMDFTGRVMEGYIFVAPAGVATDRALRARLQPAIDFVGAMPPKPAGAAKVKSKIRSRGKTR